MSLEHKTLDEGEPRVRFTAEWIGSLKSVLVDESMYDRYMEVAKQMANILAKMEKHNAAPVLPDGKVGGNASYRIQLGEKEYFLVSKSGKYAKKVMDPLSDFCLIETFDAIKWAVKYLSEDESILPTSDSPMHAAAFNAQEELLWSTKPGAILHGHALASEKEAAKAKIPCSVKETLCSTPEDTDALMKLMEDHPYPEHKVFIRKGHGFILLAKDLDEAWDIFHERILPFM